MLFEMSCMMSNDLCGKSEKRAATNLMSGMLVVLILAAIVLVLFLLIIPGWANKSSKPIKGLMACNTDWAKCACLLHEQGSNADLAPFECPDGALADRFSANCPKACSSDTFTKDLKDAQDAYKKTKDESVRGHCCSGNWKDYET